MNVGGQSVLDVPECIARIRDALSGSDGSVPFASHPIRITRNEATMSAIRRVFQNDEHQAAYERDGFVVLPCLDADEVRTLSERYDQLPAVAQAGFFSGVFSDSERFKRESHELLSGMASRFAQRHLHDYRILAGNFVVKLPGAASEMVCHQDWTFVDERKYASINIWTALTDTSDANGALYLLRGSHRIGHNVRGTDLPGSLPNSGKIPYADMAYVPVKAGQAIVHDHRVIHGGPPNRTQHRRLASACCMIPVEAAPIHYYRNSKSNRVEVYEADTEFFMKYTYGKNCIPDGTRFIRHADEYQPVQFSQGAIDACRERKGARA